MRTLLLAGLVAGSLFVGGCTTRGDVWNARQNLRETRRNYRNDNRCGPRWGRPCRRW